MTTKPFKPARQRTKTFQFLCMEFVPRAAAEIFDRSRTAAAVIPQLAAGPQPQVFYEKFHFQNMSKKKSQSKEKLEKIKKIF